jgi:hypothetical protein
MYATLDQHENYRPRVFFNSLDKAIDYLATPLFKDEKISSIDKKQDETGMFTVRVGYNTPNGLDYRNYYIQEIITMD